MIKVLVLSYSEAHGLSVPASSPSRKGTGK